MTERWRKRLGDLDKESPGDDVYERSKGGPQLPEEAIARPSTSSRVVTGVAAFLIFALAISVFAIPALRLREGAGGQPLAGIQPLWPWQTVDEVEDFTNDPSPVGVIGSQEFFDPEGTAWAFGHEVLGWSDPQVADLMASGGSTTFCSVGTPVGAPSAASGLIDDAGCQNVGVDIPDYAAGYPNATPSSRRPGGSACMDNFCEGPTTAPTAPGSPSATPPYRIFEVSSAADVCTSSGPCLTPTAIVTVYQPLGPGDSKAWAVLSSEDRTADLSVGVGSVLHDGESVTASLLLPPRVAPSLGLVVGAGDCRITVAANAASSTIRQPNGVTAVGMRLDVDLPAQPAECSETEPGYVFMALTEEDIDPGSDPMHEVPTDPLVGIVAVPIVVEWSEGAPSETGTPHPSMTPLPTASPLEWTTYTDPLGWTIDVPTSWNVEPFDTTDARTLTSRAGARFFTGTLDDGGGPAAGDVLVTVSHDQGPPIPTPADDSTFPLSADDLEPNEGGRQLSFRGDGLPFMLDVRGGSAETLELSAQQDQIVSRMIESIRFDPWELGQGRNGWTAVSRIDDVTLVTWANVNGNVVALIWLKPGFVLLDTVDTCGEGQNMTSQQSNPLIECPDGTTIAYQPDGQPFTSNPPQYRERLRVHPVVLGWDGSLLANLDATI